MKRIEKSQAGHRKKKSEIKIKIKIWFENYSIGSWIITDKMKIKYRGNEYVNTSGLNPG